jgi:hypothetical protein
MGQIANGVAKGGGTYILKVQSKYDGQIANGVTKGERTYKLKMQSGYVRSDREWRGKGRKDVQSEDAERVQQVRSRMVWRKEKGRTA